MEESTGTRREETKLRSWMLPALVIAGILCLTLVGLLYTKSSDYNELEGKYEIQSQELASTQAELSDTETELVSAEDALSATKVQLSNTQTTLSSTEIALSNTQTTLSSTEAQLSNTKTQLGSIQDTLVSTQTTLANAQAASANMQAALSAAQQQGAALQQQVTALQHKINLYNELGMTVYEGKQPPGGWNYLVNNPAATNPTWQQLESFLLADPTDDKLYVDGVYMCGEFAEDVHNNAEAHGIRAAWVYIDWETSLEAPHALNVFVTSDQGAIYIDSSGLSYPTDLELDTTAHVEIGEPLTFTSMGPPYTDWTPFPVVDEIQVYW